jgi:curved DNA-binding protein CbpA
LPFGASVNEVKKAYHQLAFRYHPDKNPNNKFAEQQFLEISEAYQLLSEDAKRTNYCNAYITFLQEQQYSADNYSKPPTPREIFETKVHPDYRDIVMKHYRPVMGRASKRDMRRNSFNYSFIVIFIFISIIMSFLALKQEKEKNDTVYNTERLKLDSLKVKKKIKITKDEYYKMLSQEYDHSHDSTLLKIKNIDSMMQVIDSLNIMNR